MNLFYTKSLITAGSSKEFTIEGQEAVHASKVLRFREGERINATNGAGIIAQGGIIQIKNDYVRVEVEKWSAYPRPVPEVAIAVGSIKKRDRLEFALEKAVEMGVLEFIVFPADHSGKQKIRKDRLESVALGAMKQSLRAWMPSISVGRSLRAILNDYRSERIIFADETKPGSIRNPDVWHGENKLLFVVGPEGGYSEAEKQLMRDREKISLGGHRLRTETAVIAIAALFLDVSPFQRERK